MALFETKPEPLEKKPEPGQMLAPTRLIVSHLLGAAVMLYFVSYPASTLTPAPAPNDVFNVAELQPPSTLHVTGALPINETNQQHNAVE